MHAWSVLLYRLLVKLLLTMRREMELFGGLLEEHKANVKGGMTRDCFISSYLRARADSGHEDAPGIGITEDGWMRDKFLAYTAGSMLEAGSDTTASTLQIFLLCMLSAPEALKKAQEEIDRVVGPGRMPTWEDEEHLPYLIACIKETMRIRPAGTTGTKHLLIVKFTGWLTVPTCRNPACRGRR